MRVDKVDTLDGGEPVAGRRAASKSAVASGPVRLGGDVPPESPAPPGGGGGLTRITVNLTRQAVHALEQLSDSTGYSKTDTINRALQVYAIVNEIMQRSGGVLNVKHEDGELERIHIV